MSRDLKDYVIAVLIILILIQVVFQPELNSEVLVLLLTPVTVIVACFQLNTAIKSNSSNHTPLVSIGCTRSNKEVILSITNAGNSPVKIKELLVLCTVENGNIESFDLVQKNKLLSFNEALNNRYTQHPLETLAGKKLEESIAVELLSPTKLPCLCDDITIEENTGLAANTTLTFYRAYIPKDKEPLTDDERLVYDYFCAAIATLDFKFKGESVTGEGIEYSSI
jgi:hypothetical protein